MPIVSTSLVLARPGTPTSSAWPPERTVTSALSITRSWPKMTVPIACFGGADVGGDLFRRADDHVLEFFDAFFICHVFLSLIA